MDRRTFLIGAGGLLAAGAAAERTAAWIRRRVLREWVGGLSTSASAHDLGVEYLTRVPDEASRSRLVQHLGGLVSPLAIAGGTRRAVAAFNAQLQSDFTAGDLMNVGGWLLSRTELRLCALVAIDGNGRAGVQGVFQTAVDIDEARAYWTAPTARFTVPAGSAFLEFQLRSGAPDPQRVVVTLDDVVVDELIVDRGGWHRQRYAMGSRADGPIELGFSTTPEWRPRNDFRTIGIAVDRVWGA